MPATEHAFVHDKPNFMSGTRLSSIVTNHLEPYQAQSFLTKRSFDQVSTDSKGSYTTRSRLDARLSSHAPPINMPFTTVQETSINEEKERPIATPAIRNSTFAKHPDIVKQDTSTLIAITSDIMIPSHSYPNTTIACNPDSAHMLYLFHAYTIY
jgi:hypothetical protein